ncbi:MAG: ribonuclease R [Rudaea sp.]
MKKKSPGAGEQRPAKKKLPGWLPAILTGAAPRGVQPQGGRGGAQQPGKSAQHPSKGAQQHGKSAQQPGKGVQQHGKGAQQHGKSAGQPAKGGQRQGRSASPQPPRSAPRPGRSVAADPHGAREAQRYENPIASRDAILAFLAEQGQPLSSEAVASGLQLSTPRDVEALGKRLGAMLRDGQLLQNRRGDFCIAQKLDLIPGTIIANAEGFGFLRADAGGDDIYISPAEMRKVMHGDRVLASVIGVDRRGRKQAAIVEVLERRTERLVGRIVIQNGVIVVAPDDRRMHQDVLIAPGKDRGARSGQIVVAEITEPPTAQRGPIGEVVSVLGERLTPSIIVEMAIAGHGLPHEWPPETLREAEQVEPQVTKADTDGRLDLRKLPLVTIDGEDARDFDDAVFAEAVQGGFRLIVAIADVSHYVRPGTALDDEAVKRSTSVYFPGFVVPMLPETLSNGICSLNPKVERLCMACEMHVGYDGEVTRAKFHSAVMRSHARLTYTRVWQALGENNAEARGELADVLPQLETLHQLYRILARARAQRGAIDFESKEVKFRLATSGEVEQLGAEPRNDAHKLIEECMIAANVEAAKFLDKAKIPALYRVHATPPASKYEDLQEFLLEFGLRMPPHAEVKPADFSAMLKKIRERPDASLIESVLLRSQSLAVYSPQDSGHFGLALEHYAHFTSPIRRYPDLLVHRAIRFALGRGKVSDYTYSGNDMASLGTHCSHNERRADEAERDVDERYKCAWMEKHVGSEFDGIVSGVTSFGLFVELKESQVSGLVHITQLPNDYYHFDPIRHMLSGERRGVQFRLGDAVRVQVLRASMEDRKIDFRLAQDPNAPAETPNDAQTARRQNSPGRPQGKKRR